MRDSVDIFPYLLQVHSNGPQLDDEILADEEVQAAIREEGSVHRKLAIANTDRAALGRVGGAIARLHGDSGFAGTVSLELEVRARLRREEAHTALLVCFNQPQAHLPALSCWAGGACLHS